MHAPPLLAAVLFGAKALEILLWIGLAALTIAFVVLMCTRWGQTKPISKCVVLSLFAHVLLCAYAYGTRLVFDIPLGENGEKVTRLTLLETGDESESRATLPPPETKPWEQLAANDEPQVTNTKGRPRLIELPTEQANRPTPPSPPTPTELALEADPERPTLIKPESMARRAAAPAPSTVDIEAPVAERPVEMEPIGPQTAKPSRVPSMVPENALTEVAAPLPAEPIESSAPPGESGVNAGNTPSREVSSPRATDRDSSSDIPQASVAAVAVPRRSADGVPLPSMYQSRVAQDRLGAAKLRGGNAATEAAVEAALLWLATHQSADGRWDASRYGAGRETKTLGHDRGGAGAEADTGVTGLALLAFLAAGHTHLEGKYRENVQHGLEFLLRTQREDGYLAGRAELFAAMYCHGMAALALSEAYAMTGDERLRPFVERAVRYTLNAQHSQSGGWRYQPAEQGDMSQFGWQVMALKSAELAGIEIPERARVGMTRFLRSVSSGKHKGLASYRAGEGPTRTMTAEALACRVFLNVDREENTLSEAAEYIVGETPQGGRFNLYYWYYGTLAMYQLQDGRWDKWNEALQAQLLLRQRTDGDFAGSFDTDDLWGGYGGRVYTTAVAALCLEVYYRYLPLYERGK